MLSSARIRANKKYMSGQDNIILRVRKGKKGVIRARALGLGKSVNAYLNELISNDLSSLSKPFD
jgi:hypothetical protein